MVERGGPHPQVIHGRGKLGDKHDGRGPKFVDKAVAVGLGRTYGSVCPKGPTETTRQRATSAASDPRQDQPGRIAVRTPVRVRTVRDMARGYVGRLRSPQRPPVVPWGRSGRRFLRALSCARPPADRTPRTSRLLAGRTSAPWSQARAIRSSRMYGRSTSGTTTDPSGCWLVSRIAATVRGRARPEPLSVWRSSGFAPASGR